MKKWLFAVGLLAAAVVDAAPFHFAENGKTGYSIVVPDQPRGFDRQAADDLKNYLGKMTGAEFRIVPESKASGGNLIYVGQTAFAGKRKIDFAKLGAEEWVIRPEGKNLILSGGYPIGSFYAVWNVLNRLGCYSLTWDQDAVPSYKKLTADIPAEQRKPAFDGRFIWDSYPGTLRASKADPSVLTAYRLYKLRNGINGRAHKDDSLWLYSAHNISHIPQYHSLSHYVPLKMFEKHPEYFSMNAQGKRIPNGQLCFSNQEVRKLLTKRFRIVASKCGKGVYMVGSNDTHNVRYCYCEKCAELMKKYQCNGGPLWDYMLELCADIKDMPGVYVTTLIYKGWEQTEQAPVGVKFPANFIADAGLLNADRTPSEMGKRRNPDGTFFVPYDNLKQWCKICSHVSCWYYCNSVPTQGYRRIQKEFREFRAAGVRSVGSCGVGGGVEFSDINQYMFFQLARNPEMDAETAVREILAHKYGAAAEKMYRYMSEAQQIHFDLLTKFKSLCGSEDTYEKINYIPGEKLVEWQKLFDEMTGLVKADPRTARNVRIARVGLDCWTTVYAAKMRQACPDYVIDSKSVLQRGLAACREAEKAGMVLKGRNLARKTLESMEYYAYLKDSSLPKELAGYDPQKVHLYLPERPMYFAQKTRGLFADDKAAAGVAMHKFLDLPPDGKIQVELYDAERRKWLLPGSKIDAGKLSPDRYTMVKLGRSRLPRQGMLVLAKAWGSSLDIRGLGRFYDPSYHERLFDFWASCRLMDAPDGKKHLLADRIYLVEIGMPHEVK